MFRKFWESWFRRADRVGERCWYKRTIDQRKGLFQWNRGRVMFWTNEAEGETTSTVAVILDDLTAGVVVIWAERVSFADRAPIEPVRDLAIEQGLN